MILNKNYSEMVQAVIDGEQDPLTAYAELKQVHAFISDCISQIEGAAMNEAEKWKEKTFLHHGFKFERKEGRRLYDFKSIQQWVDKQSEIKKIEDMAKAAADAYAKGRTMIDDDTGEVVPMCVVTYSKSSLSVKPA